MNIHEAQAIKDQITVDLFDYFDNNRTDTPTDVLAQLREFAKFYHVLITKKVFTDKKKAFKQFIINHSGYNETIVNLYNALNV